MLRIEIFAVKWMFNDERKLIAIDSAYQLLLLAINSYLLSCGIGPCALLLSISTLAWRVLIN